MLNLHIVLILCCDSDCLQGKLNTDFAKTFQQKTLRKMQGFFSFFEGNLSLFSSDFFQSWLHDSKR